MPVRATQASGFNVAPLPPAEPTPAPSMSETWSAAFGLENDVVNAVEAFNKPIFPQDPNYPLSTKLKDTKYWTDYRDNFIGVRSDDEFNYIANKIDTEQQQRDVLFRSGWTGTIAAVGAGVLSPTMFLPWVGEARGAAAIVKGLGLGALAGAAQEIPLQLNQETRTTGESVFAIGAATVLGGVLGGAHAALLPGEEEAIVQSMANVRGTTPIPTAAGADVAIAASAGKLSKGAQSAANVLDTNPITRSPVTDTIMSDYESGRWMMAQMSDAGLTMERNALMVPTTPGGTIENRVEAWYGNNVKGIEALDDQYSSYIFGQGNAPAVLPNARAFLAGSFSPTKMSKAEFRAEITKAGWNNDTHEVPEIAAAAAAIRKEVYEPILKEMQRVGLLSDKIELLGDPSYINRLFNKDEIKRDPEAFVQFITERFNTKLQAGFAEQLEKFQARQTKTSELLEDINRPQDQIDELREQYKQQLEDIEKAGEPEQFNVLEDTISALRGAARKLTGTDLASEGQRKQMLKDARDMEISADPKFREMKGKRTEIQRRLSNLNKARVVLEEKLAKKVEKIDRAEELSMKTLNRAAKAGYRILSLMDKWSDEVLDEQLSKLRTQFGRAGEIFDHGEERINQLRNQESPSNADLIKADQLQDQRAGTLSELSERIADAEDLGRPAVRDLINDMLQESLTRIKSINDRRTLRTAKMKEAAAQLNPKVVEGRIQGIRDTSTTKARDFWQKVEEQGGEGVDPTAGKADFSRFAREAALQVKDKIMASYIRLPTVDIMQGKRGAVLTRALDIPSPDMSRWLETDIEKLMRSHVRTLAPDIEMTGKYGTVNGEEQFGRLVEEMNSKLEAVKTEPAIGKDGKPLLDKDGNPKLKFDTPKKQEAENIRIQDEFARVKYNLEAVMGRLRHTWGIPDNPDGAAYRFAKTVMNLNVLRYMGGVTISSVPDVARPVMRYGLTRTFRDGWIPLVTNFKRIQMSALEARRAGVAVDAYTQSRAYSLLDVAEDYGRGTKFERGIEYASGKQGLIAAFSYWTDAMKGLTSSISIVKLMDSIAEMATKDAPSKTTMEFLASNGIGYKEVEAIWGEVSKGGGGKSSGVWMPNTEDWTDDTAIRSFRAALAREVNNVITTPGVERPTWVNATTTGKMLSQFKSFAFSSTYRTTLAGMQQRDMAFVNGMVISLALGALSYYLNGVLRGGDTYDRMMKAGLGEWADQATQRSGVLSVVGLGQDLLSRIPMTAPYTTFSGGRTVRRGGDDLVSALGGPSFDYLTKGTDVLTTLQDPSKATVHSTRQMLPWQNTVGISRIFDAIENSIPVRDNR